MAGGPAEAIVQPEWSPDGVLHFSSDRTGWWNLYRGDYEPVTTLEAEVGGPMWEFDESWYAFLADGRIVCTVFSDGSDRLAVVDATAQPAGRRRSSCATYSSSRASSTSPPGQRRRAGRGARISPGPPPPARRA